MISKEKEVGFLREHHFLSNDLLFQLLLNGEITLKQVTFELRANINVYTGALRVSRNFHDRFIADVKIIMEDILLIAGKPDSYLYQTELYDIIRLLHTQLSMFNFKGEINFDKFVKNIYTPFSQELQEKLPDKKFECPRRKE